MSFLKVPEPNKIYRKELPKVGKKFRPGEYTEYEEKLNIFQVIFRGLLREEMEPKYYKKYDNIIFNFKVYLFTFIFGYCLFYATFHSSFMNGSATEVYKDSWFDKTIDVILNFLADQWEALVQNLKKLF